MLCYIMFIRIHFNVNFVRSSIAGQFSRTKVQEQF